jgi:hypothetical protein
VHTTPLAGNVIYILYMAGIEKASRHEGVDLFNFAFFVSKKEGA